MQNACALHQGTSLHIFLQYPPRNLGGYLPAFHDFEKTANINAGRGQPFLSQDKRHSERKLMLKWHQEQKLLKYSRSNIFRSMRGRGRHSVSLQFQLNPLISLRMLDTARD